ncbi:conserved hypothetical protein [Arthrobacter sp. 9V]|uniref:hypothetical protein n=1 Tax=Arthrobacter sp. 9V TaxID=2653132 RepID=UPI0012F1060E|nr:hypothetical protein [Arthrobacter sp. 9V]VXC06579.1 conserved hypothetical protein [Arthrobacter sp. 9V]
MGDMNLDADPFVVAGLRKLSQEAFGPSGFALGMDEVIHVLVHRRTSTFGYGYKVSAGQVIYKGRSPEDDFSHQALNEWLSECRNLAYVPGLGTWTTAEVHVFPDAPGRVDFFDEEHLKRDADGDWDAGGHPAGAQTWIQQLLAYPRTLDNIPAWILDIIRAEGLTPPVYNPQYKSVDWNNKRRPVTDNGTDVDAEPMVIDPTLEPGIFAKISKKLFGA